MGDLRDIALWYVSPPSDEDVARLIKVAGAVKEVVSLGGQLLGEAKLPVALAAAAAAGIGEFRKNQALLNPNVQRARNEYYGAR